MMLTYRRRLQRAMQVLVIIIISSSSTVKHFCMDDKLSICHVVTMKPVCAFKSIAMSKEAHKVYKLFVVNISLRTLQWAY